MNHPPRSTFFAAVLGFILPGTGQMYCKQDNKGVFLIGFFLLGHWATNGISSLFLCPAMGLDAFLIARKINRGLGVARWEFFPGIKFLNRLPQRVMPLAIVILLTTITIIRILIYASDYRVGE
ncbi:MAG TPA: hypothetical protein VH413_14240 [Verrucomicrobiae bacterium]|jgi:TM2 domain-containing membrane protein YozV|nr:hypothetical protein [Verrucomicrobiae bacterium]